MRRLKQLSIYGALLAGVLIGISVEALRCAVSADALCQDFLTQCREPLQDDEWFESQDHAIYVVLGIRG